MKIRDIDTDFRFFEEAQRRGYNCLAVVTNEKTGAKQLIPGRNIVLSPKGNRWYATRAAGEASNFQVVGMKLGLGSGAVSYVDTDVSISFTSCYKALDGTYPQTSDADTDNTGRGSMVVTFRVTFNTTDISQVGIRELALVDASVVTNALNHALFAAAFDKTYNDTLKVFVNHTMQGV